MVEGGVDDGLRVRGTRAQTFEIFEASATYADPGRREGRRGLIGSRETFDRMAGAPKFLDDGRPDPARCARDENTHDSDVPSDDSC